MEQYIILWLYVWGGAVTAAMLTYANLVENGERHMTACVIIAVLWPVSVPTYGVRLFIRRQTKNA